MLADTQVLHTLERMSDDMRMLFDLLPADMQQAYLTFWETRPDRHGAHRDTLPAFMAGLFASMG